MKVGLDVPAMCDPCFTAVEEGGDADSLLPRYLKDDVMVSGLWSMVKAGRVCGVLELHWQTPSVLEMLTDRPILL